jgi:hypothetical protein
VIEMATPRPPSWPTAAATPTGDVSCLHGLSGRLVPDRAALLGRLLDVALT